MQYTKWYGWDSALATWRYTPPQNLQKQLSKPESRKNWLAEQLALLLQAFERLGQLNQIVFTTPTGVENVFKANEARSDFDPKLLTYFETENINRLDASFDLHCFAPGEQNTRQPITIDRGAQIFLYIETDAAGNLDSSYADPILLSISINTDIFAPHSPNTVKHDETAALNNPILSDFLTTWNNTTAFVLDEMDSDYYSATQEMTPTGIVYKELSKA